MNDDMGPRVEAVLQRTDAVLGPGYSAILYGSGARGEALPGSSDINLLLVADQLTPGMLQRLSPVMGRLDRTEHSSPLLFERAEWARASDVFPIEITDMQHHRTVLRGPDVVAGLLVRPGELRRALEGELRAKVLGLRRAYALQSGDAGALGVTAQRSVGGLAALIRVTLLLLRGTAPVSTPQCLSAFQAEAGVPTGALEDFWRHRGDRKYRCAPARFEEYLSSVVALVGVIDGFTIPGGD